MKPSKKSTSVFVQGEPKTAESSRSLLVARFFDPRRYDLAPCRSLQDQQETQYQEPLVEQTIAEPLVDAETGEILVEAGTVMTRDVIDSISEQLDNGLNKITYIPNDAAVLTEPVELQNSKLSLRQIQTALSPSSEMLTHLTKCVSSHLLISWQK